MSSLQERMLRFIDEQLDEMLKRPSMWGPSIAVELQALQLLQLRSVVLRPALEEANPRAVLDAYEEFLARRLPGAMPEALASLLERDDRTGELTAILGEFRRELVASMGPEDIFQSHDLVLRLWLRKDVTVPRASTLSSYYDVFRRVLRAVSRPYGTRGRAPQAIEDAMDFIMPEVSVTPANGAPAHIVLPLDRPERPRTPASASVDVGIQRLVAVNEWAAERQAPVSELARRLDGREAAQHVAAQALRLMPSAAENLQAVELGGRLAGRAEPIKIEPTHSDRMVLVVKQSADLVEFDEIGTVRAVDIDQCSMRLRLISAAFGRQTSIQCWMDDAHLVDRASKALGDGARVRVMGRLYRDPGSPAMVIVRAIQ